MTRTYRAALQASLHDAPNPLDPVGATNWGLTRASGFVTVDVAMTDEVVTRQRSSSIVATRTIGAGGVWALFVDQWGPAKPLYWATLDKGLHAGDTFEIAAGRDHLTMGNSFAVRNAATTVGAEGAVSRSGTHA